MLSIGLRAFQSWPLQGLLGGHVEQQSLHLKGVDKWHLVLLESKWWFPTIRGTFLGGPHNKGYNIWESILGSLYFGRLLNSFKGI